VAGFAGGPIPNEYRVKFSGLAPGYVGLFQVNVQVPANVPTGDAVNVVLTVTNKDIPPVSAPPVTIAVQ
jgi:uncharacterized protein (TIGR03437 family)